MKSTKLVRVERLATVFTYLLTSPAGPPPFFEPASFPPSSSLSLVLSLWRLFLSSLSPPPYTYLELSDEAAGEIDILANGFITLALPIAAPHRAPSLLSAEEGAVASPEGTQLARRSNWVANGLISTSRNLNLPPPETMFSHSLLLLRGLERVH